jgi:hypothetical protein
MTTPNAHVTCSITSNEPRPEAICPGVLLASIAIRVRVQWHAGVIDADTAMKELDSALVEICALRQQNQTLAISGRRRCETQ